MPKRKVGNPPPSDITDTAAWFKSVFDQIEDQRRAELEAAWPALERRAMRDGPTIHYAQSVLREISDMEVTLSKASAARAKSLAAKHLERLMHMAHEYLRAAGVAGVTYSEEMKEEQERLAIRAQLLVRRVPGLEQAWLQRVCLGLNGLRLKLELRERTQRGEPTEDGQLMERLMRTLNPPTVDGLRRHLINKHKKRISVSCLRKIKGGQWRKAGITAETHATIMRLIRDDLALVPK